jgi:hypothetical protein
MVIESSMPIRHQESVSLFTKGNKRTNPRAHLYVFESPKNKKRLVIQGSLVFWNAILHEGSLAVAGYEVVRNSTHKSSGASHDTNNELCVYFCNGSVETHFYQWTKNRVPARSKVAIDREEANNEVGATNGRLIHRCSEKELMGKEMLIENWLILCAAITRARAFSPFAEMQILRSLLNDGNCTLGELLKAPNSDPGLMLATIASGLQNGSLHAELEKSLIGLNSVISRGRKNG